MENEDFRIWIQDNQTDIEKLLRQVRNYKIQMREKVKTMRSFINIEKHNDCPAEITEWLYNPPGGEIQRFLVHDFKVSEELKLAIDTIYSPSGWMITVVPRKPTTRAIIKDWFTDNNIPFNVSEKSSSRIVYGKLFDYHEKPAVIADALQELIDRIVVAVQNNV